MRYTTQFPDGTGINLTKAMCTQKARETVPPAPWIRHSPYHWSRELNGYPLEFWPSKDKWLYKGRTHHGDVDAFITSVTNG